MVNILSKFKVISGDYREKRQITSDEALEIMIEEVEYEDKEYLIYSF